MNVATFLGCGHGVFAFCDFESVFLGGLMEFHSFHLPVFFLDVACITASDLDCSNTRLSLLIKSVILYVRAKEDMHVIDNHSCD